jgi:hypothetical protein
MPDGITKGLKKVEEKAISGARGLGKEAKQLEEKAVSAGKSEYEKLRSAEKGLVERARTGISGFAEQQKMAGEYERGYMQKEPKQPISPEEREAKAREFLAPRKPLTDLLGVKKEDGAYAQMEEQPCKRKMVCQQCEFYDTCESKAKVRKPKTDEESIDEFFGQGWDDMTKGWERLG